MAERKIRILVGKPGLDGHDRGAKTVASALRDAGMVGLSILSGAHMALFPRVREELVARNMGHVLLTGGGIIPGEDVSELEAKGYAKLFGPGTPTAEIATWIGEEMKRRWASEGAEV